MNHLIQLNNFSITEKHHRERENFQYSLFKDIDFKHSFREPVSFFRSDFRGAKFENIHFYQNNFDRADFIDATFINVIFEECFFGTTEINNCYFKNCSFKGNTFAGTSMKRLVYCDCEICLDNYSKSNISECKFTNSLIKQSNFERATFEEIEFTGCKLEDIDFSVLHAEYFTFKSTTLNKIVFGLYYWQTYLYDNLNFENIQFKYRGEIVNNAENHEVFSYTGITYLLNHGRFFEYLNTFLIIRKISKDKHLLLPVFEQIISRLRSFEDDTSQIYQKNWKNIFRLIPFYFAQNYICIDEYIQLLALLKEESNHIQQFKNRLWFQSSLVYLEEIFSQGEFSWENTINLLKQNGKSTFCITIDIDEPSKAQKSVQSIFFFIANVISIPADSFNITGKKKNSWEFEVISTTISMVVLLKLLTKAIKLSLIAKKDMGQLKEKPVDVSLEYQKKVVKLIQDAGSAEEMLKVNAVINQANLDKLKSISLDGNNNLVELFKDVKSLKVFMDAS